MTISRADLTEAFGTHMLNMTANTKGNYRRFYRRFVDYFGDEKPITVPNLKKYQAEVISTMTESNQNTCVYATRSFLGYLFRAEMLDRDLSRIIEKPRKVYVRKNERAGLDKEDIDKMIATADRLNPNMAVFMRLAHVTGARKMEIATLRKRHFQEQGGFYIVTFPLTKNGRPRKVKIQKAAVITNRLAEVDDFLFPSSRNEGHPLSEGTMDRHFRAIVKATPGLKHNYSSHWFRHHFVTEMVEKHGIEKASKLVGHADLKTTQGYAHVDTDDLYLDLGEEEVQQQPRPRARPQPQQPRARARPQPLYSDDDEDSESEEPEPPRRRQQVKQEPVRRVKAEVIDLVKSEDKKPKKVKREPRDDPVEVIDLVKSEDKKLKKVVKRAKARKALDTIDLTEE